MILNSILFIVGILIGIKANMIFVNYLYKQKNKKETDAINAIFSKVLKDINEGRSTFTNRMGNNITLKASLNDVGVVEVMYMLDKEDIAIFSGDKCIYTSSGADKDIIDQIITKINITYKKKINNIVNVMGVIYYKPEFEKKFNVKIEDLQKQQEKLSKNEPLNEVSDIDKIIQENKTKLDIDDILDKISSNGMLNLTDDEKKFLKKYNN